MGGVERGLIARTEPKETISLSVVNHVLLIPDNNRTWAKEHNKTLQEAYTVGAQRIIEAAHTAKSESDVHNLTVVVLTADNITKRPQEQLNDIHNAVRKEMLQEGLPELIEDGVRLHVVGRTGMLPRDMQTSLTQLVKDSKDNSKFNLTLGFGYDPNIEMEDALAISGINPRWETVKSNLYLSREGLPEISAIIRTGPEQRLSGIFPHSISQAELLFTHTTLWPEFTGTVFKGNLDLLRGRVRKGGA